jgi:hypothetical protein
MDQTPLENLGMAENLSWETEEQEKRETFNKIMKMKQNAFGRALRERRKREIDTKPEDFPEEEI